MANDPAFLFYPGDYLRDTQILSEAAQVAYDRIMCEHMRNICITQQQLKFITKRLTDDQLEELMHVLTSVNDGYQIAWVAESINKRRAYSESRRKNRTSKPKKDMSNISKTYVQHMENEIENVNVNKDEGENEKRAKKQKVEIVYPFDTDDFMAAWQNWKDYKKEQFRFTYKPSSEQGALTKLSKLTDNPKEAVDIIMQSIENGWKGLFALKEDYHYGKRQQTSAEAAVEYARRKQAEREHNAGA